MSNLSGFDGEAVGFDSVSADNRSDSSAATQTSLWGERGVASQTVPKRSCGTGVTPADLPAEDPAPHDQTSALAEFLRRVVPGVLRQLDEPSAVVTEDSSDSEPEPDVSPARLVRELLPPEGGAGDAARGSVLACSWDCSGATLAVSRGHTQHEAWCDHAGRVLLYSHPNGDVTELDTPACVTSLRHHPTVSALLAVGTAAGEVRACDRSQRLVAPQRHTGRVSALAWAQGSAAQLYLTRYVTDSGQRRGSRDAVLLSAGSDGVVRAWRVNLPAERFDAILEINVNTTGPADITCLDVVVPCPLRPADERVPEDTFVVGTREGAVLVGRGGRGEEPRGLKQHEACVVAVQFSGAQAGVFASLSADGELRVHRLGHAAPTLVLLLEGGAMGARWVGGGGGVLAVGSAGGVALCSVRGGGRLVGAAGVDAAGVTAMDVTGTQSCLIACGLESGAVRVWELPAKLLRASHVMD